MNAPEAGHSIRSMVTLIGLAVLLVIGVLWGWSAVSDPLPTSGEEAEECTQVSVSEGDRVVPTQVTVSVLNASGRAGLAAQTMRDLLNYGYGEGDLGNAPPRANVPRVQVWAEDRDNPAARLVARYVVANDEKPANIIEREAPLIGVNVVIGDGYKTVVQGPKRVKAKSDATFCSPPTG